LTGFLRCILSSDVSTRRAYSVAFVGLFDLFGYQGEREKQVRDYFDDEFSRGWC
jgi:hypothetical protein